MDGTKEKGAQKRAPSMVSVAMDVVLQRYQSGGITAVKKVPDHRIHVIKNVQMAFNVWDIQ